MENHNQPSYNPAIAVNENVSKTPFVRHFTRTGVTFSCIYSDGEQTALVALFNAPNTFDTNRVVPVRIHSSCANSDILDSFDCDCRSQLIASIDSLRSGSGVLIHIFQEGRGAGIFAKYLGMYTMQAKGVSTYQAYKELDLKEDARTYPLVSSILKDLNIKDITLLSNNPRKLNALEQAGFTVTLNPLPGKITPQNFSYLFSKFSEGEHEVSVLFPENQEYYFSKTPGIKNNFKGIFIFDADDTLWEDNIVYEKIISDFIEYHRGFLKKLSNSQVRELIDVTEEKTIEEFGYGPHGFLSSLRNVHEKLCEETPIPEPLELFNSIIPTLTKQPEKLTENVTHTLIELQQRGYGLILYTQGPLKVQFEKIARSNLGELFHALCIVKRKGRRNLENLLKDFEDFSGKVIVVGNSLRSDIRPALESGFSAIHYNNPNSWLRENDVDMGDKKFLTVQKISDILDINIDHL